MFVVVMEMTCIPSLIPCIAWFASLRSEEVVIGKSACGHFLFMVVMEMLKYTCSYQASPPCIVWCASLRSEEVVIRKSARGNFLSVVVMEKLKYTCVPSFTSMHCMVCKFEK